VWGNIFDFRVLCWLPVCLGFPAPDPSLSQCNLLKPPRPWTQHLVMLMSVSQNTTQTHNFFFHLEAWTIIIKVLLLNCNCTGSTSARTVTFTLQVTLNCHKNPSCLGSIQVVFYHGRFLPADGLVEGLIVIGKCIFESKISRVFLFAFESQ